MRGLIPMIVSVYITIIFSMVAIENVYSQTGHEHTSDTLNMKSNGGRTYVKGITRGRARSLVGVAVGLIGLIIGFRAKNRSKNGVNNARSLAIAASVLGVVALFLNIIHFAVTKGGFGTGGGKAGSIVGVCLALWAIILGILALRAKRTA